MTGARVLLGVLVFTSSPILGQVPNDTCTGAIVISEGVPVIGSNVGATTGPDPVACNATNDVWYAIVLNCGTQYVASTCGAGTNFDTLLSVWNGAAGCGALTLVGCNDNNCPTPGPTFASRVTFTASAGGIYYVSVGGKLGGGGSFSLRVDLVPVMTLAFFYSGPGTIGYYVTGPPSGSFFTAVAMIPGAFPFGWFYGIDLPLADLVTEFNFGPPFVGSFSPCGLATMGPFGALPPGLTIYAVALGFSVGSTTPNFSSNPTVGTVP